MRAGGLIIFIFLLLGAGFFLFFVLPVQVRFLLERRGGRQSLLLRIGIFNGRIGIGTRFFSGRKKKMLSSRLKLIGKIRARSFSPPHRIARSRWLLLFQELRFYYSRLKKFGFLLRDFFRKSFCSRFFWETTVGLTDYAATGMIAGMAWAWKGSALGILSQFLRISPAGIKILVIPDFGKPRFEFRLECILETRFGHIIIGLLRYLVWRKKLKGKPDAQGGGRIGRSSY